MGGVSFLTTDTIPIGTIIDMEILRANIFIRVEIKSHQIVNEKNFYGGRIIEYLNDGEEGYRNYIAKQKVIDEAGLY